MEIIYDDGADLASAKAAAANADATVIVVGLTMEEEDETRDRLRLSLPERYEALIKEVAGVSKLSVVLVEGGGAVTMEAWKDLPDAIVMSWYAGMEAGNAMADVIFGDANPSAKLPITFPESEDQLFVFDNTSLEVEYGYYHGYRYFDKHNIEPAFPFGFGLSYTSYAYSNLVVGNKSVARDGTLQASVEVKNTGDRQGDEIVQLYVGYKGSAVDRPIKDLKAFKKVSLDANQKKTVVFELPIKDLAYYDVEAKGWKVEQIEHVLYIGPSSRRDELLVDSFRVV